MKTCKKSLTACKKLPKLDEVGATVALKSPSSVKCMVYSNYNVIIITYVNIQFLQCQDNSHPIQSREHHSNNCHQLLDRVQVVK